MLLQYVVVFIIFNYVNGDNTQGSLTFVIDDTRSMYDDIEQVKKHTNQVFDAVLSSNASKIDDFIIVTFNDPGAQLYTVTRDRDVFKKALAEITVRGNLDCPEYAMKGIELALENSKPNSFFYVFTDAAAKDYKEYDRIKSLALKKSIQVTFLLTGECPDSSWESNAVYDKLAAATNGQVFHLEKKDIQKIMGYIITSVNHIKTTLAHKYFDTALNKKFQFSIDSKVWDVIISVSGLNPRFHITGPDGNKVEMKTFIDTKKSHISKLEAKPGVYTVHLDSKGAISTVITGSTAFSFQHGFATVQPNTLKETSTKPISGLPSYLSIALDNIDKDLSLDTVEIRDINDKFISEFPLTLINKKQQFYITKPLLTPNSTFKLAISGHTKTKEKITRVASTTIEPQKPELEGPKPKVPTVTILEGIKIIGDYDRDLTLKCKVNAFPKPDVIWQDNLKTLYSSEIVPLDLPYEYMSILKIDKVNKNFTIQCRAGNVMGEKSEHITVETKQNYFIKVLAFPKDTTIEYGAQAELNFRIKSFPQVKITWYINGKEIQNNTDYEVSSDRLRIRQMRQELKGNYTVEAFNDEERKQHHFKIDISGVIPVIDKSTSNYKAKKGSNVNISCRILKSKPSPVISWTFKPEGLETSIPLKEVTETLHLHNVGLKQIGTYTCLAHNDFGRDSHGVDLFVEYPPIIEKVETQVKIPEGELVNLHCKVDSSPLPLVRWLFNKVEINNTEKYIFDSTSLSFTGSIEDNGIYTCEAINSLGKAEKAFFVTIFIIPVIDKSISDYKAERGSNVKISCKILKSKPSPVISWTFKPEGLETSIPLKEVTESLHLKNVGLKQIGMYTCSAHNEFGRDSHGVDLFVEYPPIIEKVETQVKIPEGELVNLHCKVDGSPLPLVRWLLNNVEINNTEKYIYNATSLSFTGSVEDNGIYSCEAINSLGKAEKAFFVTIFIIPVIDKSISDYKAERGSHVNISCRILKSKPSPVISWTFKQEGLETSIPLKEVTETLHLHNVGLKQIGTYTCLGQNEFGRDSHGVDLFVEYAPTIEKVQTQVKILKGQPVILTCKVDGSPFPTVRWLFNDVEINNTEKYILNANSLSFTGSIEDNGIYTCEASNNLGEAEKHIYVTTHIPIKIAPPKNSNLEVTVGDSVNLACLAEGYPKPKVQWTFYSENPSNLPNFLRADSTGSISVKHIQVEDEGFYRCFASNVEGMKSITYKINVRAIPEPVSILANPLGATTYDAVQGDLTLRIPCNVTGSPKPVVTWETNGYYITSGTHWFDIEEDGTLIIKYPTLKSAGSYTCRANNDFSSDLKEFTVNVTPYPQLDNVTETLNLEIGSSQNVECDLPHRDGDVVTWFKDGRLIATDELYLRNLTIQDSGVYSCRVSTFMSAHTLNKEVNVGYKPIFINEKDINIDFIEGTFAYLDCSAYGEPKPQIIWKKNGNLMKSSDMDMTYIFEMKPDVIGSYECVVSNKFGNINRTFIIQNTKAPVSILANPLEATTYDAVQGDLALRIPCNAIGNPKPVVTWEADGYIIISGTHLFDIEEDGTLIIKYPTLKSAGSYICRAKNDFSSDLKEFTVNVTPYPQLDNVTETLNLEIGSSQNVECDLPHRDGNVVTWFKDGRLIATDELYLTNLTIQDSGVYSCRVSTFMSARTLNKEVNVGYKPIFINEKDINIDFIEGTFAYLDCSAYGEPKPQIIWKKNGNFMKSSDMDMTYIFEMKPDVIGSYECVVSNKFGNINRTFIIQNTKDCLLDIEKDFNKNQPLLLSRSQQWPDLKKLNNFFRIPKSTHFLLSCPGNTVTYNEEEFGENVKALCIDNSTFKISDRNVDFSKIKCKKQIKSLVKSTNQSCFSGNTELLKVGFMLQGNILEVYDICIDKDNKIPVFTRHNLHKGISGTLPKEHFQFTGSKYLRFSFDDMYQYKFQLQLIHFMTGKNINDPNKCCFKKRQLVNPADVIPGLSQVATFSYLNVIPHWSTCGTENWDEIERRIRSLAMFSDINLSVFTGSSYPLTLPGQAEAVFLSDRLKRLQPVPMFIWKVVLNTHDKSSLAIIQLNIPNINLSEALSYVPCEDICNEVEWMKNYQWHDVDKGFTFCCSMIEFASYYGALIKGHDKVFKSIPQ